MFILFNLLDVRERLITTESGEPKERARDLIINWQGFVKYCKKLKNATAGNLEIRFVLCFMLQDLSKILKLRILWRSALQKLVRNKILNFPTNPNLGNLATMCQSARRLNAFWGCSSAWVDITSSGKKRAKKSSPRLTYLQWIQTGKSNRFLFVSLLNVLQFLYIFI